MLKRLVTAFLFALAPTVALAQAGMEFGPNGKLVGKVISQGNTPVLSSCGTGPTIVGSDTAGQITTGSGATTCTITFSSAWNAAPSCILHAEVATQPTYTVSTTAITGATTIASTQYNYVCFGSR